MKNHLKRITLQKAFLSSEKFFCSFFKKIITIAKSKRGEKMEKIKKWVFTDCDGVWLDRTRQRDGKNNKLEDYIALLEQFKRLENYGFVMLTDRGGAQLPPVSFIFQGERFQGGESGAVAYDNHCHRIVKNPDFIETIYAMREIEKEFTKEFKYFFPLEPGVYSSLRVERVDNRDLSQPFSWLTAVANKSNGELVCADHGDCVSLKPSKIEKGIGIKWLAELYENAGIDIDFSKSIWIGDGKSDIPAAKFIHDCGGRVSAVANSNADYLQFIKSCGGYVAKKEHTAGMVEILSTF